MIFVFFCLTLHSALYSLGPSLLLRMTLFHSFYGWVIFSSTYIPHLLIHSSLEGPLGYYHVLAIRNNSSMNIGVQVSFLVMVFSGYMPRSRIAKWLRTYIFSFLRKLHTVLHSGCISLHSHQQCKRVLFSPQLLQHFFVVVVCLFVCRLSDDGHSYYVRGYFNVVLTCISLIKSDVEHLSVCFMAICLSSLEKC